jgi:WD40 repeat protein
MRTSIVICLIFSAAPLVAAPKADPYGDPLPDGAVNRIGTIRLLHDDTLTWADFSADGKRLVTGGMYGEHQIHVWDVATGRRVALLPTTQENETWAVATSADGKRAAAILSTPGKDAYRMWLTVWNAESGKKVAEVLTQERAGGFERVVFAPDGKSAAVRVGKVYLVDLEAGRVTGTLDDPDDWIIELRYVAGGRLLFVGGVRSFTIWDVKTRRRLDWENLDALGDTGNLSARSLSADGRTLVLAGPETILAARLKLPTAEGGRVWVESVKKFKTTGANKSPLVVAADGAHFAVADANGAVELFAFDKPEPIRRLKVPLRPVALYCGADAALVAERGAHAYSRQIHLWDLRTGKELTAALGLHHADGPASWSADGSEIITGTSRWDPATGKHLGEAKPVAAPPAWKTPDGRPGLLSRDGRTALASVVDGPKFPPEPRGSVDLVVPFAKTLEVWDAATHKRRTTFRDRAPHLPRIGELAAGPYRLSNDGRVFAATDHTEVQLWDTASGRLLATFDLHKLGPGPTRNLDLSPDGRRLLVATPEGVAVIDIPGRSVAFKTTRVPKYDGLATCRFAPDGRRVALVGSSELLILDFPSGDVLAARHTGQKSVAHVAFSPDGRRLLTQGGVGWCLVWDVPAAERVKPFAADELEEAWGRPAGDDAAAALTTTRRWSASGAAAVEFLGRKLRPEPAVATEEVRKLVAELGASKFRERETARKRLQELGEPIVPALRAELERAADPEVAERLRRIVDHPDKPPPPPPTSEVVRGLRALEALEHIGTPAAREVIERMAKGPEGMPLAEEARAILRRVGN